MNLLVEVAMPVATVLLVWAAVVFFIPAVARARCAREFTEIHDRLDDAIIMGELGDSPPAREMVDRLALTIAHLSEFNLRNGIAAHWAAHDLDIADEGLPTYGELSPQERRLLYRADREAVASLARMMVNGSTLWPILIPARWAANHILRRISDGAVRSLGTPSQWAEESWRAMDELAAPRSGTPGDFAHA